MAKLNIAKILAADDYPLEVVHVPEWKGSINLKRHSLRDAIGVEESSKDFPEDLYIAVYLSYSIVNDDGTRAASKKEEIEGLAARNPDVLLRLFKLALAINKGKDEATREKHEGAAPQDDIPAC